MMQPARILRDAAQAPRLLPWIAEQVVDLTYTVENDVDYYMYELRRYALARAGLEGRAQAGRIAGNL